MGKRLIEPLLQRANWRGGPVVDTREEWRVLEEIDLKVMKNAKHNGYKSYTVKVLVSAFAVLVLLALYIEFFPMNFFSPEYAMLAYQKNYVERGDDNPRILIMGDSRAMAGVIPRLVSDECRSLCVSGGTPIELYYLLKEYLSKHDAPEKIFLSISPFHLQETDSFWGRTIKCRFLSAKQTAEVFSRAEELNDPVLGDSRASGLKMKWFFYRGDVPFLYASELADSWLFFRLRGNIRRWAEMEEGRGHVFFGTEQCACGLNQEAGRSKFRVSKLLDSYLHDLLELAENSNIKVVMEAMPMNSASAEALTDGYIAGYGEYMGMLSECYHGFVISTEIKSGPNDHFGDSNHMNRKGAEEYSKRLAERLRGEDRGRGTDSCSRVSVKRVGGREKRAARRAA